MDETTVTSKGQVTIPQHIRRQLGIHKGSRLVFRVVEDHMEVQVVKASVPVPETGYGMLKSDRAPVPVDFDPAVLVTEEPGDR
jgi:AbrB family looped-hinge helix DNA binding protein